MVKINPFTDDRKIPEVSINVKVKINTDSTEENANWNKVFGYLMRKPRTKVEFINVSEIRNYSLDKITLEDLRSYLQKEDFEKLKTIENIFDNKLTQDVKAFVLSILKIKPSVVELLAKTL